MNREYILNLDRTVMQVLEHHFKPKEGEIGIEIEIEGEDLVQRLGKFWRVERDGSLRGHESAEYVLIEPLKRNKYVEALEYLTAALKKKGSKLEFSGRAGVHIHVNFQTVDMRKIANMVCLYMMYEDALTDFCGEGRTGNLFCLGSRYAENVIDIFKHFITAGYTRDLHTDNLRYASINLKALTIYGSIEFRSMRSTVDIKVLTTWVELLLALKDAALKFKDPMEILTRFSQMGGVKLTKEIFKGHARMMANNHVDPELLNEAMWRIQPIVFSREWGKAPKRFADNNQYYLEEELLLEKGNKNLFKMGAEDIPRPQGIRPIGGIDGLVQEAHARAEHIGLRDIQQRVDGIGGWQPAPPVPDFDEVFENDLIGENDED